jgi:cell fate (sporulation/competence/biofilm development) regulator YlbF (YheA/YmcA/DUF963 family)
LAQAYDQRDEAQSKISAMKEKNEKDARNFGEEMKELQRTLDHDEKLKNFLFHKVINGTVSRNCELCCRVVDYI